MSDSRRRSDSTFLTHRELEESIRRAEIARADYNAVMLGRFLNRLRDSIHRPAAPSGERWDRLGEPLDPKTKLEVG